MNDLRSVDEKKPKFLRSSTLIEDGSNIREDRREGDKNWYYATSYWELSNVSLE